MKKSRPYVNYSVKQLKDLYLKKGDDIGIEANLRLELSYRRSQCAKDLQNLIDSKSSKTPKTAKPKIKKRITIDLTKLNNAKIREVGLLSAIGYRVGNNGEKKAIRHDLLDYVFKTDLPTKIDPEYLSEWGDKKSPKRLYKLLNSLSAFIANAKSNTAGDYSTAIKHWEEDYQYLKSKYYDKKHSFELPSEENPRDEDDSIDTSDQKRQSAKDKALPGYDKLKKLLDEGRIDISNLGFDPLTNSQYNRFVWRLKFAKSVDHVEISGYSNQDTPECYEGLIRCFILWTTFERYLYGILDIKLYEFARDLEPAKVQAIYDHYKELDKDGLLWNFFYEQTDSDGTRRSLEYLRSGTVNNILYFGMCIRHMFAHGYLMANPQGVKAKDFKKFLKKFYSFLLDAIISDYNRRIELATQG